MNEHDYNEWYENHLEDLTEAEFGEADTDEPEYLDDNELKAIAAAHHFQMNELGKIIRGTK